MTEAQRAAYIAALIQEREGYERAGRKERAAEVTAELRRLGAEGKQPAKRAERRPQAERGERRA